MFYLMDNPFGDLIRLARIDKGWSQRELARRIAKSATYIHYVERGINPSSSKDKFQVGVDAVDTMAKVLGISIDEARLAAGYASSTNDSTAIKIGDDVRVSMLGAKDFTDDDREEFTRAFEIAYEMAKKRIEDKRKEDS